MTIDELKTKSARQLIIEAESVDVVLDTIIEYVKTLEQRIETLENR